MNRHEILLKLVEIQIGMKPPAGISIHEALKQFDSAGEPEHRIRFHRAADFVSELLATKDTEIGDLKQQLDAARALNNKLVCSWCGHETTAGTREECIAAVAQHLTKCKKHPIRTLLVENERLRQALTTIHKMYGALAAGLIAKKALGLPLSDSESVRFDDAIAAATANGTVRECECHCHDDGELGCDDCSPFHVAARARGAR